MSSDFQRVEELYHQALSKPLAERASFLALACSGDEALRREVEALLACQQKAGQFMDSPALDVAARMLARSKDRQLIGSRLGPYEVLSLLGVGGMGEVYLARDTRLERTVALKVLPAEVMDNPERMKRFVQEAKAASRLNHPNIATIYEVGEAEGIQWIAMEYVEGQTLEWRIGVGADSRGRPLMGGHGSPPLQIDTILDIGMQVSEAVEAAHQKGIIHRDLKPANIMLTAEGRVKVLDFGLAKRVHQETLTEGTAAGTDSQTMVGVIMGTVAYMSPEQVLGQEVDHRTDLFSLGVVLYYMVSGRLPFGGASPTETIGKILHTQPEAMTQFNDEAPAELERVVKKCLEKDRERRYQSARELLIDLKNLQRDSDTGKLAAEVAKPNPRRYLLWGTALLLTTMAAAFGFWILQSRKESPEAPLVPVPLTTYPGEEGQPSFSPNGNQVAFVWNGKNQDNYDIYIKEVGSESVRRLTTDPRPDRYPAWSPDDRSIAFVRYLGPNEKAVMLVPANGGRERQIATLKSPGGGPCWHPGGKWLAVAGDGDSADPPSAMLLLSPETGERRRLTSPPRRIDTFPAFSPDGRSLAFARWTSGVSEIYVLPLSADLLPEGEPRQLTFDNKMSFSPAWMPDGKEIIYVSGSKMMDWGLRRISASGSGKPRPLPFSGGDVAQDPAISLQARRFVYKRMSWESNIWRCQIPTGAVKPEPPSKLMPSTRAQETPQYSPDGKSIAYVAWTSGNGEIWVCDSDGMNPLQLTHLGGRAPSWPHWSPDGQRIVFDMASKGQRSLYVIPAQGGEIRQLTSTPFNEGSPTYSRDGRWIYFGSDRSGVGQVWKIPAEGGDAVQVTRNGGSTPLESRDGKTVFYIRSEDRGIGELWKVPVNGGDESRVLEQVVQANFDVRQQGIYYISPTTEKETSAPILFYDFARGKTKQIGTIRDEVEWGLTVSPDEQWILFTQGTVDALSDLMLVENFR